MAKLDKHYQRGFHKVIKTDFKSSFITSLSNFIKFQKLKCFHEIVYISIENMTIKEKI